jgi:hypothetical protein
MAVKSHVYIDFATKLYGSYRSLQTVVQHASIELEIPLVEPIESEKAVAK